MVGVLEWVFVGDLGVVMVGVVVRVFVGDRGWLVVGVVMGFLVGDVSGGLGRLFRFRGGISYGFRVIWCVFYFFCF